MNKTKQEESCCGTSDQSGNCCRIMSVVTVDERGQMVLPKEIREKAGIGAGDKLAIVTWEKGDEVCCLSLMKVEGLTDMVKETLGPVMKDILEE